MEDLTFIQGSEDSAGMNPFARYDWRVFLLEVKRRLWFFLLVFAVVAAGLLVVLNHVQKKSMRRWQSQARLFHQIRSDRVPSFYKQMDTKVISEFAGSAMHLQEVARRLNLSPEEAARIASLVAVEVNKAKPNIIAITASYNNANMAAELANSVADVVLAAYIEMQNSTLRGMLDQRQQRRVRLQTRLAELEAARGALTSPDSFLNPDDEQKRLSREIVEAMGQIEADRAAMTQLRAVITESERLLGIIPTEVPYLRRIRTTDTSAVDTLQGTLDAMRLKFTDNNPRVIALASELANARQKLAEAVTKELKPDEEVYIANQVRMALEESMNKAQVELAGLVRVSTVRVERVEALQKLAPERLKLLGGYLETQRNIETITTTINQLDTTINDMELLLHSAVPDLSVLEYASPPRVPASRFSRFLVLAVGAGLFLSGACLALFFLWDYAFGRLCSPRNFSLGGNVSFLGMLPVKGEVADRETEASLQRIFMRMRGYLGQGRRLFLAELSANAKTPEIRENWNQNFGINGIQAFWLTFAPPDGSGQPAPAPPPSHHRSEIDDDLIAIEKLGNRGVFRCSNPLVLSQAELDLLNADLKALEPYFSLVILERGTRGKLYDPIFDQLCVQADYTVLLATFGQDKKGALDVLGDDSRLSEHRIGCVLTQVRKKYWNLLRM
jgi:hypothetical protein